MESSFINVSVYKIQLINFDFVKLIFYFRDMCGRRGEKAAESGYSMNANFNQESCSAQLQWRDQKVFGGAGDSTPNRSGGFSLDQPQFSPQYSSGDSTITSQAMPSTFHMDSAAAAFYGNQSNILQALFGGADNDNNNTNNNQQSSTSNSFPYPAATTYGINEFHDHHQPPTWSKAAQFLRTSSPPKQPSYNNHLHFSNNAPYWNASEAAAMKEVRPSFFPSLQPQFPTQSFEEKPKVKLLRYMEIFYDH